MLIRTYGFNANSYIRFTTVIRTYESSPLLRRNSNIAFCVFEATITEVMHSTGTAGDNLTSAYDIIMT